MIATRDLQLKRQNVLNKDLGGKLLEQHSAMSEQALDLLDNAMDRLKLSARAYHRIIRLARTIADMENSHAIDQKHIAEAVQFRCLDRESVQRS